MKDKHRRPSLSCVRYSNRRIRGCTREKIERSDNRPVISFGVDLNQINLLQSGRTQRTLDRMARNFLRNNLLIRNPMLAKVRAIERSSHRRLAACDIKLARALLLGDSRL